MKYYDGKTWHSLDKDNFAIFEKDIECKELTNIFKFFL